MKAIGYIRVSTEKQAKEGVSIDNQRERIETGRIKLSDTQDLVASLVNDEKLDLRVFVKSDSYTGATKRGFRLYLFDEVWTEFKGLIDKVDKVYQELACDPGGGTSQRAAKQTNKPHTQDITYFENSRGITKVKTIN